MPILTDWLSGLDWITHLVGAVSDLSGATALMACPARQWPTARCILEDCRIGIVAMHCDEETAEWSVNARICHLAWHTLARAGISMLTLCPPPPGRRS